MLQKCSILLLFLSTLMACSPLETIENKDDSGVLLERYTRSKETFAKEGKFEAFYPSGKVMETATYKNDVLSGERTRYYENGKVEFVEQYVNGQFEGPYKMYSEEGQLLLEGQYVNNRMDGVWKNYYKTGELKGEAMLKDNNENGPFTEYFQNGKVMIEGTYFNGDNEQGELKKYNEAGEMVEKMYCEYGVCATTWTLEEGEQEIDMDKLKRLAELKKASAEDEDN